MQNSINWLLRWQKKRRNKERSQRIPYFVSSSLEKLCFSLGRGEERLNSTADTGPFLSSLRFFSSAITAQEWNVNVTKLVVTEKVFKNIQSGLFCENTAAVAFLFDGFTSFWAKSSVL